MLQLYAQPPKTKTDGSTNAHSSQKYEHRNSESGWTYLSPPCTWGWVLLKSFTTLSDIPQVQIKVKGLKGLDSVLSCSTQCC